VTETDDFVVQILRENRRLRQEVKRLSAFESSRWWRLHPRMNLRRLRATLGKPAPEPAAIDLPAPTAPPTRRPSPARDDLSGRFRAEVLDRGRFKQDWFTGDIASWEPMMGALEGRSARVLEIGSFEGLSACYLLWRLPDSQVTCVDTFAGSEEHVAGELLPDTGLERAFDANVALVDASRVRKLVGTSKRLVGDLYAEGARFEFVYVDGSHRALDVLVDAAQSWAVLSVDGFLVFDDYRWSGLGQDPLLRPGRAIDSFLTLVDGKYELLFRGSQLAIHKTAA
jgi:predicted O-methyltransferase YrrM